MKVDSIPIPTARTYSVRPEPPRIRSNRGSTVIRGQEEIATIAGSATFSATKHSVNPGLSSFTWLSTQAAGWDRYRFRKLQFVYVPAVAVTTTPGSIYLVPDYDPSDSAPSTLEAMSSYEGIKPKQVFKSVSVDIPVRMMEASVRNKKIRCGPVAGDLQLYDPCSLIVATVSCSDTSDIGQLWVYYEVEFINRQVAPSAPVPSNVSRWMFTSSQSMTNGVSAVADLDSNTVDGFTVSDSSGTYTLPPGMYRVFGVMILKDTTPESLFGSITFRKNGSAVSPTQAVYVNTTTVSNGYVALPYDFYVSDTSSMTISLYAAMNGSAGTLTLHSTSTLNIQAL
jgi:hypothetical protein